MASSLIGIDFGSESARGVRIDIATGRQEASRVHRYRHGIVTGQLRGTILPPGMVLQVPADYLEAAEDILADLGQGREIAGIGIDFTASSPMPARADGTALAALHPDAAHAYVKLWKHSAQSEADAINAQGGDFLLPFGGRLSGEWLLPKAAEIAHAAPEIWAETERFIEAGDWLVWRLTGSEARSLDFAAYKAQYDPRYGYPEAGVPNLRSRLAPPLPVGSPAGSLNDDWRQRTGIRGAAVVAVCAIDSHGVLPAVGAVSPGIFVGALGTSAGFLILDGAKRGLPQGLEGAAFGAALPDLWCTEAGQAAFGDMLAWYVRTFPQDPHLSRNFARYNEAAASVPPGSGGLLALDWFAGNRVPLADSRLSGLLLGLGLHTRPEAIYRALIEALCYGTRTILETALAGGVPIARVMMTSGLARSNPLLVQILADCMNREIEVPEIENPTAVGAAIHGAVAAGVVPDFATGASRFGAKTSRTYRPSATAASTYESLYRDYRQLAADSVLRERMHALHALRV